MAGIRTSKGGAGMTQIKLGLSITSYFHSDEDQSSWLMESPAMNIPKSPHHVERKAGV
jgi:hypothetical protein